MNFAIIGCGRIATNHIKAALDNKLNIVALCDVVPSRMPELLAKHNVSDTNIKIYTDYKKMIAENKLDLIAIATESGLHSEIACDCIINKISLIIEKPIALSINDANKIIALAKEYNVKVSACHQNRFNKPVQVIRKALDNNRFGKLSHGSIHVRWNRDKGYYKQAPWRGTWAQDGGALMNQSIHGIDLLRWLMGVEIEEVFAYTRKQLHDYLETEDLGMAVVKFKNGAIATVEGTTNIFPENLEETLYIFGANGTAKAGGKSLNTIDEWKFSIEQPEDEKIKAGDFSEQTINVYGNGHTLLYKDMIEAIEYDSQPYVTAEDGKNALELVLAIYKSQKTGLPVQFPLKDFSTLDMGGTF